MIDLPNVLIFISSLASRRLERRDWTIRIGVQVMMIDANDVRPLSTGSNCDCDGAEYFMMANVRKPSAESPQPDLSV